MAYKKTVEWNIDRTLAKFRMSVKGGKLPDNYEAHIDTDLSFKDTDVSHEQISSLAVIAWRVAVQRMLRDDIQSSVITRLQAEGLKAHVGDAIDENLVLTPEDRQAMHVRFVQSLDPETKAAILAELAGDSE